MKYLKIVNRFITPIIVMSIMCTTATSLGQNITQEAQTVKEEMPAAKFQIVESPNVNTKEVTKNRVQMVTMEKSDKMEVVEVKGANSNSKALPKKKIKVVRKVKSDKIDQ